eukprot:maker-scaffold_7-snap-gene-15.41-mRNA-1 protein AED:0.01 eAED:0.01 QI:227/1/1/1/0/0.5/2/1107/254
MKRKIVKMPENFWRQYGIIRKLREKRDAPVDYLGCQALADRLHGEKTFRFQVLTALLFSSQTKDQAVGLAINNLKKTLKPTLCLQAVLESKENDVHECIKGIGFHNTKLKNLYKVAKILKERFDEDIPHDLDTMVRELPGIGPKMAIITLNVCFPQKPVGIGIDTHVFRMAKQLHWTNGKTPEKVRKELETWVPKEIWSDLNLLLVGLGQQIQQKAEHEKLNTILDSFAHDELKEALRMVRTFGYKGYIKTEKP